jgi:hypothetical protein
MLYFQSAKTTASAVDEAEGKEFAVGEPVDTTASAAVVHISFSGYFFHNFNYSRALSV